MKSPRISVITIGFNAAPALRRTIASVNEQTFADIEHILIDGGSTDGSPAEIQRLARRNAWWLSERDRGIADAFNKGTRHAQGDYLCYLNAGDVFADARVLERVAAAMAQARTPSPTVFYGDFVSNALGVLRRHRASAEPRDFAWDNPLNHQSAFVPRALALALPYDERLTLGMDYDFWLRALPLARFEKVPGPIAIFDLGGRSSAPEWVTHSVMVHRALWHLNRGTRMGWTDGWGVVFRVGRLRFKFAVRALLGVRASAALRSARSYWIERRDENRATAPGESSPCAVTR